MGNSVALTVGEAVASFILYPAAGLALVLAVGALATALVAAGVEARFPAKGRFVKVFNGRLHVLEAGPTPGDTEATVVLIHGAAVNAAEPMSVLGPRLAGRYRVLAVDRPGHGWSDRFGADAASPARQAAVIAEGLRRLGVSRAVIVGHSWAGSLVADLALDHTDVTGAILLLAPVTHPWPTRRISWYHRVGASVLGGLFARTLAAPGGLVYLARVVRTVFGPQRPPADYIAATKLPLLLRPEAFRASAADFVGLYAAVSAQSPRYREIRVPSAVVAGDTDPIAWLSVHAVPFAREVPGSRLTVLPGIGHMPHHVATDAVVAEIDRLARGLRAARAAEPG